MNSNASARTELAIVGVGRMGGALQKAAEKAGLGVVTAGRDDIAETCAGAQAVLLCVPDHAISESCAEAARAQPTPSFIGHLSGATGLSALAAARDAGAEAFSLHPLQTVPAEDADLSGTPCAVAAESPIGMDFVNGLATKLGMAPFEVGEDTRPAYHAAASMASNYLIALEESAVSLLARAGIPDGRRLLAPLVLRTAENWAASGSAALTGPIARGDEETVERHIEALEETAPELLSVYSSLAERTRAVAGRPAVVVR